MAQYPELVRARFETKSVNSAGVYLLTFYVNGVKTPVLVDDHLPVDPSSGKKRPVFAHNDNGVLWGSLLEKGWAKLHGSYARIETGHSYFTSEHLTGVPATQLKHKDIDAKSSEKFWQDLKEAKQRNFLIMAGKDKDKYRSK